MAAGLQRYKPFATAIEYAESQLHALGANWSLNGTYLILDLRVRLPRANN